MKASLNTVVSFNIQAVVLLANPDLAQENFSAIDFDDCVAVGVDGDEPNDTEDEAESSLTAASGDEDVNNEWI
ncbi:hypothetical protein Hypma_002489 [Hypsizygus marmoreus]|uniref:Uncharacterized protein n=1 Tax=Hypsizygus marmoreus TaxID=39966 RepID=A0A369J4K8_HYPMA|nr:hypothetical protein Hypma_002489 [Hypsizygus marmoreus]